MCKTTGAARSDRLRPWPSPGLVRCLFVGRSPISHWNKLWTIVGGWHVRSASTAYELGADGNSILLLQYCDVAAAAQNARRSAAFIERSIGRTCRLDRFSAKAVTAWPRGCPKYVRGNRPQC